jgi:hypothetical protein
MRYLRFLVARDELDLAGEVWQRCLKNDLTPDFEFKASSAFSYIDRLLLKDRVSGALKVWDDALRKSRTGLADMRQSAVLTSKPQTEPPNLVWNGSFENVILQGGFDWRYSDTSEARFEFDTGNRTDRLKSLRLTFGNVNTSSVYLRQIVPVFTPGPYALALHLKTEGLTTDQRPYISIQGFPDGAGASARSSHFPATTDWTRVSVPFVVKDNCRAVDVILRRDRSSKFDNQIKGSLWLDDVSVRIEAPLAVPRDLAGKEGKTPL